MGEGWQSSEGGFDGERPSIMKKLFFLSALALMSALQITAQTTLRVNGINYNVYDAANGYVEIAEGSTNVFGRFVFPGYVEDGGNEYKVKRVAEYAFFYVSGALEMTFEDGLSEIQQFGISYCENLRTINLPRTLRTLGPSALCRNGSLSQIAFPEGFTTIDRFVCMGCTSLSEVYLPSTLTTINKEAFKECPVNDIYCYATTAPWVNPNAFTDGEGHELYEQITLHVLPGCAETYAADATWGKCNIVEDLEETAGISTATSRKCDNQYFDLQGRPVSMGTKAGLFIQGGKKVLK